MLLFMMTNTKQRAGFGGLVLAAVLTANFLAAGPALATTDKWRSEWPNTDFSKTSVDFSEILGGGPPKDGIPSIDNPQFIPVSEMQELPAQEPVVGLTVNGVSRAYPMRLLTWHEIVNDVIGGVPVAITYCPLCNSAIVFDRRVGGETLEFGVSGKLRISGLIMYDRNTESWWQQFLGEAIVGEMTGTQLRMLPSRIESWERFAKRKPDGQVLIPNDPNMRSYGLNPYIGYDTAPRPFLFNGEYPEGIEPMAYVVAVGDEAWSLDLIKRRGRIEKDDLIISWEAGNRSALDRRVMAESRDLGNIIVQRQSDQGPQDITYDLTFAFVFNAFRPEGKINK